MWARGLVSSSRAELLPSSEALGQQYFSYYHITPSTKGTYHTNYKVLLKKKIYYYTLHTLTDDKVFSYWNPYRPSCEKLSSVLRSRPSSARPSSASLRPPTAGQASRWLYAAAPRHRRRVPTALRTVHPNYSTQYVWVSGVGGYCWVGLQIATHVAYIQPCDDLLSQLPVM